MSQTIFACLLCLLACLLSVLGDGSLCKPARCPGGRCAVSRLGRCCIAGWLPGVGVLLLPVHLLSGCWGKRCNNTMPAAAETSGET